MQDLMFEELKNSCKSGGVGGFLPGMKQIANVAALPGIVGVIKLKYYHIMSKCSNLFLYTK